MKHKETQTISVRLPKSLVAALDERARTDHRSRSNLVSLAVEYLIRDIV